MKAPHLFACVLLAVTLACGLSSGLPAVTLTPSEIPVPTLPIPFSTPTPEPTFTPVPKISFPTCQAVETPFDEMQIQAFLSATPTFYKAHGTASLRELAEERGMLIGAGISTSHLGEATYTNILRREFNVVVAETAMRWDTIHPEPLSYDFSQADQIVSFAQANGMAAYGHMLVWDYNYPDWLTQAEHSRDEWIQILCQHVKTVVSHYRGRVFAWLVVNEAVADNGNLYETLWLRKIGPEYLAMAFQWAHEADPQALLIYNDHAAEGLNDKSQAIYAMIQGFVQLGIPIDGVGLQMHIWLYGPPTPQELAANMRRYAELGLQVHITEMDVRTQYSPQSLEVKLRKQAETYQQVLTACLEAINCKVFMTWGVIDRYSWIKWYTGKEDAPLLFDGLGLEKPAYYAIREALSQP